MTCACSLPNAETSLDHKRAEIREKQRRISLYSESLRSSAPSNVPIATSCRCDFSDVNAAKSGSVACSLHRGKHCEETIAS